jgi:hypothetical protein
MQRRDPHWKNRPELRRSEPEIGGNLPLIKGFA